MKVSEFNQTMAYLLKPKPKMQQAKLVDDLEPGSLKDELLKDFDPKQETYEEYLRRKSLEKTELAEGGRAKLAVGALPFIPTAVTAARPFVGPLLRKGAEALTGIAVGTRLGDIFFSKEEGEDKKDVDPDDKNIIKRPDPLDPKNLEDLASTIEIAEAVERLKKKEMDVTKRDKRTPLARDLDLAVTKSGLYEIRKGDYFNKRLQTLKDKGVNFDGYYSTREIANLLGIKTNSGIIDFVNRKKVPTVKKGLYYYMNRAKKRGTSTPGKGTVTDKALKRSAKTAKKS